ncbi:hypothetical protein AB0C28_20850 [Nonomuraea sp. NPDC048892]|uniref:hypothetical protein n=1 Tax=Nonomuraea sp. NPDC048892 TaxID=3154624 RepID=UPI0033E6F1AF
MADMSENQENPVLRRRIAWRISAVISLGTLIPTVILAGFIMIITPSWGICFERGRDCNPNAGLLGTVAFWAFIGSAVTGISALVLPVRWPVAKWAGPALAVVQLLLQLVNFVAIALSG